jgi:hypothetical protein
MKTSFVKEFHSWILVFGEELVDICSDVNFKEKVESIQQFLNGLISFHSSMVSGVTDRGSAESQMSMEPRISIYRKITMTMILSKM